MSKTDNVKGYEDKKIINWYPGHMAKTKREIAEKINLIDVIYEVSDLMGISCGYSQTTAISPCWILFLHLTSRTSTGNWFYTYHSARSLSVSLLVPNLSELMVV